MAESGRFDTRTREIVLTDRENGGTEHWTGHDVAPDSKIDRNLIRTGLSRHSGAWICPNRIRTIAAPRSNTAPFGEGNEWRQRKRKKPRPNAKARPTARLLDLSDDAVKKMIKAAKKRGYVTMDELNSVLPSEEVTSEQIEDTMSMLSDMGINVVEDDEVGEEAEAADSRRRRGRSERACRADRHGRRHDHGQEGADRPHRRSRAHVSARDGLGRASVARGRNRHRQAHRGRPRDDDRGPVRKPPDLPGHHHLARRAQRRQDPAARDHRSRGDLCRPGGQAGAGGGARRGTREAESTRGSRAPCARGRRHHQCRRREPRSGGGRRRGRRGLAVARRDGGRASSRR